MIKSKKSISTYLGAIFETDRKKLFIIDKNRINIPLQNIYKCLVHLVDDFPIYILCNSGERATIGYSYIKLKGYNPKVITGGIDMIEALKEKQFI